MTDVTTTLNFEAGDTSALDAIQKLIKQQDSLEAKFKAAQKAATEAYAKKTPEALKQAEKAARDYQRALDKANSGAAKSAEKSAADIFDAYDEAYSGASKKAAIFGDLDANLGAGRGALEIIAPGLAPAVTALQDTFAAAEGIGRIGPSLANLPSVIGPAGLALGAVGAAAAAAFALVSSSMEAARVEAEKTADAAIGNAKATTEAQQLLRAGDIAGLEAQQKALLDEQESINNQKASLIALRDEAQASYDKNLKRGTIEVLNDRAAIDEYNKKIEEQDLLFRTNAESLGIVTDALASDTSAATKAAQEQQAAAAVQVNAIREVNNALNTGLTTEQLESKIAGINQQLATEQQIRQELAASIGTDNALYEQSQANTAALTASLEQYSSETAKAAASQNDLKEKEKEQAKAAEDAAKAAETLSQTLADFEAESARLEFDRNLQEGRQAQDEALAALYEQQDAMAAQAEAYASHQDDLAKIEQKGNEQVADLRAELAASTADAFEAIAAENASYQAEQADAENAYRQENARRRREYLQKLQDIENEFMQQTQDAVLDRDVRSFLDAQRNKLQAEGEAKQEKQDDKFDSKQAFEDETEAARIAHEQRLAEIQAEAAESQLAAQQKIAAAQAATQAEIAANETAYQTRLAKEAERERIEDERAATRQQIDEVREQEDYLLAEARRQEALAARLADIDTEEAAKAAANAEQLAALYELEAAAIRVKGTIAGIGVAGGAGATGVSPAGLEAVAFANEGVATSPTLALMGEKFKPGKNAEAAIQFNQSEGLGAEVFRRMGGDGMGSYNAPFSIAVDARGSTDAAATMRLIEDFWNKKAPELQSTTEQALIQAILRRRSGARL